MCEIIISARNVTHADPAKDRAGCYKRGYPIVVMEDGHIWGRLERQAQWVAEGNDPGAWPSKGKLYLLKLPGVPADKARELIAQQNEDDDGADTGESFRRRRWSVNLDALPAAILNALNTNGEYTFSTVQDRKRIRDTLKRVRNGVQYTGLD